MSRNQAEKGIIDDIPRVQNPSDPDPRAADETALTGAAEPQLVTFSPDPGLWVSELILFQQLSVNVFVLARAPVEEGTDDAPVSLG